MNIVCFALIIDDLSLPDGQVVSGLLGGGGPQTAFGARLWVDQVGLVGGVGTDFPPQAERWLAAMQIDTAGLRRSKTWPTPRAWQIYDAAEHRTQRWRVPPATLASQLGRSWDKLPSTYQRARGFHLGLHPDEPDLDFIARLRQTGALVSVEPFREAQRPLSDSEVQALVTAGQIFSPNQEEAESLVGPGDPMSLLKRLVEVGGELIALRCGAAGAWVHHAELGETWHIPAFKTTVVDPTGAGNAFCGGFLAGWLLTSNLRSAGLYGAVAASFLVEQFGLPPVAPDLTVWAEARLLALGEKTTLLKT